MTRKRLTPPVPIAMPAAITGPMPSGDAEDPPVHQVALDLARTIDSLWPTLARDPQRVTTIQILARDALNAALDQCQALGGRRVR